MFWRFNVFMNSFEEQWSIALKKGKQQAGKQARIPLDLQKKQLEEEMDHYKAKLRQSLKEGQMPNVEKTLNTLIELRGKQMVIRLRDVEKKFGTIPKEYLRYYSQRCIKDCTRLIVGIQTLLKKRFK